MPIPVLLAKQDSTSALKVHDLTVHKPRLPQPTVGKISITRDLINPKM